MSEMSEQFQEQIILFNYVRQKITKDANLLDSWDLKSVETINYIETLVEKGLISEMLAEAFEVNEE